MSETVGGFFDPTEAQVASGLLRAEQVPAHLRDEHICRIEWPWLIMVGGLRLDAAAGESATEARALIAREGTTLEASDELAAYEPPDWSLERFRKLRAVAVFVAPQAIFQGLALAFGW